MYVCVSAHKCVYVCVVVSNSICYSQGIGYLLFEWYYSDLFVFLSLCACLCVRVDMVFFKHNGNLVTNVSEGNG